MLKVYYKIYPFPSNVSGCYNDSQYVSETCSVTYDDGKNYWCNCKTYYNPLDGCKTNYYETLDPMLSWLLFIFSIVLDIICIIILATRIKYEIYSGCKKEVLYPDRSS